MDALDVVVVCLRRWWVVLPVLILAAVVGINMTHQQKPVYLATGGYALVYTHWDSTQPGSTVQDPRNAQPACVERRSSHRGGIDRGFHVA